MQLSASVAIVGRLAAAGIESLTVAVGQVLCNRIPIGAHGEKVLMESMGKLNSFSAFGDVVWFGIGVRHVLRSLVHTSQGASCVALCAALAECNSRESSALILYEMAKRSGSPHDLSPSTSQWAALIKTCSSIFAPSTFGIRVQQLLRLGGYDSTSDEAYDPRDVADALFAVGSVATGESAQVNISGVVSCVWIAAYADYVMGLRVRVELGEANVLWMNFSEAKGDAQVTFSVNGTESSGGLTTALQAISRTVSVSGGQKFICETLDLPENHQSFIGGRVAWDSVLRELFGQDLFAICPSHEANVYEVDESDDSDLRHLPTSHFVVWFAEMIVATAAAALESSRLYKSRTDFYASIITNVPELHLLEKILRATDDRLSEKLQDSMAVSKIYLLAKYQLKMHCNCAKHAKSSFCSHCPTRTHCLIECVIFAILLSHTRKRLVMDTSLCPSAAGLRLLSEMFTPYSSTMKTWFDLPGRLKDHKWEVAYANGEGGTYGTTSTEKVLLDSKPEPLKKPAETGTEPVRLDVLFQQAIGCFSGCRLEMWGKADEVSARSDGRIYCYIRALTGLSDDFNSISQIHVGAGSIYSGSRPYSLILDKAYASKAETRYNWPPIEECTGFSSLWEDTSPPLTLRAFAQESTHLRFWYTISGNGREVSFSPIEISRKISRALAWSGASEPCRQVARSKFLPTTFYEQTCLKVCGEGKLQPGMNAGRFVLRPHSGHVLGKCVVLALTETPVFLIRTKEELDTILKIEYGSRSADEESSIAERLVLLS